MTDRKLAKFLGHTRYTGRPCPKHPELNGERLTNDCRCPACKNDAKQAWRRATRAKELL